MGNRVDLLRIWRRLRQGLAEDNLLEVNADSIVTLYYTEKEEKRGGIEEKEREIHFRPCYGQFSFFQNDLYWGRERGDCTMKVAVWKGMEIWVEVVAGIRLWNVV